MSIGTEVPLTIEAISALPFAPAFGARWIPAAFSKAAQPPGPPVWEMPIASRTTGVPPGVRAEASLLAVSPAAGMVGCLGWGVTAEPPVAAVAQVLTRNCPPPAVPKRADP